MRNRRIIALLTALLLLVPTTMIYGRTDDFILSDPIANTFEGRREGAALITNLRFVDMPDNHAAQDAIVRSGVYNLVKGDAPLFSPNAPLTVQEALAFALRAAGREEQAMTAMEAEQADLLPDTASAEDAIYLGFFAVARDTGLITEEQFTQAFDPEFDIETLDEGILPFSRHNPATREEFAHWLVQAIIAVNANAFTPIAPFTQQSIYTFNDWRTISPERIRSIEYVARSGVMIGANNLFRPRANITRMEAAWAGRALDTVIQGIAGMERRFGTVAAINDAQALATHTGELWREVRIRRDDGTVDLLRFSILVGGTPQRGIQDAVVLRDGEVNGLGSLAIGDPVEYIVHTTSNTIFYVAASGALTVHQAMGRLQLIDVDAGTATFTDEDGRGHTYALAQGLFGEGPDGPYVRLRERVQPLSGVPFGSLFAINLVNNMITELEFAGDFVIEPEVWGVVIENNPMLGFIVIHDANGFERVFSYNFGELRVQKTEHDDPRDFIGGIHALFPDVRINPRETSMSSIEPGNVVSFRTAPDDPSMITSIHASTNYTTRYGRIIEFRTEGNMHFFIMQFDNGVTASFNMSDNVTVRQNAIPINPADVQVGDWARILVNQAIIGPGHVMESVRSMLLESGASARHISNIIRGRLTGIGGIQNQLQIADAQSLERIGWANYRQLASYPLSGQQIEFFLDGRPVTLHYIQRNLRLSGAEAYIALENHHAGERVRMVSFRTGRDELLNPDTIMGTDGQGGFHVMSNAGTIQTDPGTIVRRNGRLVDARNIMPWDHARIALNGLNSAAVVDIGPEPATAGLMIARGTIYSVDQGQSFRVQSIGMFSGNEWQYSPIQRQFTIDNSTLFFDESGMTSINDFIDFGSDSVFLDVFNIVIDGSRAARVIDSPHSAQAVRGIIYAIDGDTIRIRDAHFHDGAWAMADGWGVHSGSWMPLMVNVPNPAYGLPGITNPSLANINIHPNSIMVDRNQVVGINDLRIGDQIRIMTNYRTIFDPTVISGNHPPNDLYVDGYVVLVER